MKYHFLYIILLSLFSCTPKDGLQEEIKSIHKKLEQGRDSNMLRGINDALKDIKNETSKYYNCNVTTVNKTLIDTIVRNYNVKIISNNCSIGNYELGYNQIIDSVLLHYYGVNLQEIIRQ